MWQDITYQPDHRRVVSGHACLYRLEVKIFMHVP